VAFLNDTVSYYKSNSVENTDVWGWFFNPGIQLSFKLNDVYDQRLRINNALTLQIGATATLKHTLKANKSNTNYTFNYDPYGGVTPIDTISFEKKYFR